MQNTFQWLRDWIPVISGMIAAIGVVVTATGVIIAGANISRSLDRGRRELAVNLLYNWAKDIDWITSRALDLAKSLPPPTVASIKQKRAVSIEHEHYDSVVTILSGVFSGENLPDKLGSEKEFRITAEHSAFIFFLWARWLNRLEGTLAGWLEETADSKLIKREFAPLLNMELKVLNITQDGLSIIDAFWKEVKEEDEFQKRSRLRIFSRRDR